MTKIPSGVRVLDFGRFITGPYCAMLMADLGAKVIRVERVDDGDDRFNQYPINSGTPDQPSKSFASWADVMTGTNTAFGTLAARIFHPICASKQLCSRRSSAVKHDSTQTGANGL